jgi:hypothetical protein
MSEGTVGIIVLASLSIMAAVVSHLLVRRYLLATLCGAAVAIVVFLTVDCIRRGYPDKFLPVAFVVGGVLAFGIGLLVGLPVRSFRKQLHK